MLELLVKMRTKLKEKLLEGEISTIEMKILVPGQLAKDPEWKMKLETMLEEKKRELADLRRDSY